MDIHRAIEENDLKELRKLLKKNANVNESKQGETPLTLAIRRESVDMVRMLLEIDNIDLNLRDGVGWTPLTLAIRTKNIEIFQLLLKKGNIDPNLRDKSSQIPLIYAVSIKNVEMVRTLLQKDSIDLNIRQNGKTPLSLAVGNKDVEIVRMLLEKDTIDLNIRDETHRTPLLLTIDNKDTEIAKLLLEKHSIDPNMTGNFGRTPLFLAVSYGDVEMVKILLDKDHIDLNLSDDYDETPLSLAIKNQDVEAVWILAYANLKQSCATCPGQTPLSWAIEIGNAALVELIHKKNAINRNSKDNNIETPLLLSTKNGHTKVAKLLVENTVIEVSPKENDETPSSQVVTNEHQEVVEPLAPADKVTSHTLVKEGKLSSVRLPMDDGFKIDTTDDFGQSLLHIATSCGDFDTAKELISSGANVNAEDGNGVRPLKLAIENRRQNLIELLLKSSALLEGIMANEWLHAYNKRSPNTVVLLSEEESGEKSVRFLEGPRDYPPAEPETEKRLFLCTNYTTLSQYLSQNLKSTSKLQKPQILKAEERHGSDMKISLTAWVPSGCVPENKTIFEISSGTHCQMAWTMTRCLKQTDTFHWKEKEYFSMLPYGWIPADAIAFFEQFIENLIMSWSKHCNLAEDKLSQLRMDQLRWKGQNADFVDRLAEATLKLAELRNSLQGQVSSATNISKDYFHGYDERKFEKVLAKIRTLSQIDQQIRKQEQTIRDMLQLEFAWTSIKKVHKSTIIATSMKRLSWITFIFLPATFASGLFGMNVNILQNNPDWRWYILIGGITLLFTIIGWLTFKYFKIEEWVEINIGKRIESWTLKESQSKLPN